MNKIVEFLEYNQEELKKNDEKESKIMKSIDWSLLLTLILFFTSTFLIQFEGVTMRLSSSLMKFASLFADQKSNVGISFLSYLDNLRILFIFVGLILLGIIALKRMNKVNIKESTYVLFHKGYFIAVFIYVLITLGTTFVSSAMHLGLSSYLLMTIAIVRLLKLFNFPGAEKISYPNEMTGFEFYVILLITSLFMESFQFNVGFLIPQMNFDLVNYYFGKWYRLILGVLVFGSAGVYLLAQFIPNKISKEVVSALRVFIPLSALIVFVFSILETWRVDFSVSILLSFLLVFAITVYYAFIQLKVIWEFYKK